MEISAVYGINMEQILLFHIFSSSFMRGEKSVNCSAVILAAGKGVRMRSNFPKVVHCVAGIPMVKHVVNAVSQAGIDKITLVVGHQQEMVKEIFAGQNVNFAVQSEQLGTGHALLQAQSYVQDDDTVLVVAGDTPLLQAATLKALIEHHHSSKAIATVLSTEIENPYGYGRIIRNQNGKFERIVEEKDASPEEKTITEINSENVLIFASQGIICSTVCLWSSKEAKGELLFD